MTDAIDHDRAMTQAGRITHPHVPLVSHPAFEAVSALRLGRA
jgi:hypothetical protein